MIPISNGKGVGYVNETLWKKIQEAQITGKILEFNMRETEYNGNLIGSNFASYIRGVVHSSSDKYYRLDLFDGNDVLKKMTE